ncbi:integrase, catalytic region, zinc finger, CCHC-type containing protein [Tanacetum coccineum]
MEKLTFVSHGARFLADRSSGSHAYSQASFHSSLPPVALVDRHRGQVATVEEDRMASMDTVFNCVILYIQNADDWNFVSLVCHKWNEIDCFTPQAITNVVNLQDFFGAIFCEHEQYIGFKLPSSIHSLGLSDMPQGSIQFVDHLLNQLRELNFRLKDVPQKCQCLFLQSCPNLEILYTKDAYGDTGLELISQVCKKLRKLTVDSGTRVGLMVVTLGCPNWNIYMSYSLIFQNEALECLGFIGMYGVNLKSLFLASIGGSVEGLMELSKRSGLTVLRPGLTILKSVSTVLWPGPHHVEVGSYHSETGSNRFETGSNLLRLDVSSSILSSLCTKKILLQSTLIRRARADNSIHLCWTKTLLIRFLEEGKMELYMQNREHGRMILESVEHGSLIWPTIKVNGVIRTKKYAELSVAVKIQADCDMKATSIILQGLPADIYKAERECKLYDAFDKFTHIKGESLHTYYLRFTQLINDMNIYKMKMEQFQVNTKFLNSLPSEWSKFVTDVKLVKDLHTSNFDQRHAYLEQHELHANEVRIMREQNQDLLAFVANQ